MLSLIAGIILTYLYGALNWITLFLILCYPWDVVYGCILLYDCLDAHVDVFVTSDDILMYIIIVCCCTPIGVCVTPLRDV